MESCPSYALKKNPVSTFFSMLQGIHCQTVIDFEVVLALSEEYIFDIGKIYFKLYSNNISFSFCIHKDMIV